MKSWVFALGLALCCIVQANGEQSEDAVLKAMAAENWYLRAIVTNCPQRKRMLSDMKAAPVSFKIVSPKKIKMTVDINMSGDCMAMKAVIEKKKEGYTVTCKKSGTNTVEKVEMNGNYMFTSIISGERMQECKVATLATKDLDDLKEENLAELRVFLNQCGLAEEEINILSTEEMCPRSS